MISSTQLALTRTQGKRCDKSLDGDVKYNKGRHPHLHEVPPGRTKIAPRYGLGSQYLRQAYRPESSFIVRSVKVEDILKGLFPQSGMHGPTNPASPSFGFPWTRMVAQGVRSLPDLPRTPQSFANDRPDPANLGT